MRRNEATLVLVLLCSILVPRVSGSWFGQNTAPGVSVWDGVYSEGQSARGERAYRRHCSSCHGLGLEGNSAGLLGEPFWRRWGEDSLGSLYDVIRFTMPHDFPGGLGNGEYVDVTAYLLWMNGLPAGATELFEEDVAAVRVEGEDGPGPVPDFSLVRVTGCLAQAEDGRWMLTLGSDPVRTRNPEPEPDGRAAGPPGATMYHLLSVYPSPEAHEGSLVEAKGLLIRSSDDTRLNVTSVRGLGVPCG